jgi:hypothetical protein
MVNRHICPACGKSEMEVFFELNSVPTNSVVLLSSFQEAVDYPRGDIKLGFCSQCGFISNVSYDPKLTEYSSRYEPTQGFSQTFNEFHKNLADRLIKRYDLHNKKIIEIGCGKGEFLNLLCSMGKNKGVGFDPAYEEGRLDTNNTQDIQFIKDFYSEKYANYHGDFLCCKMTLEHIYETNEFVTMVRSSLSDTSEMMVFFQVPETLRILRDCAFEDIYYEHCSYFTPGSLGRLFRRCGFEILNIKTEYDNQYITIESKPKRNTSSQLFPSEEDLETLRDYVVSFPKRCQGKFKWWKDKLQELRFNSIKTVLWGSGSKGVSFLTSLNVGEQIEYVVDINPYRQGHFMSGTGQKIVSPKFLKDYKPGVIIVMNSVYCNEIKQILSQMELFPELIPL